jgi:hypothetical protein
MSSINSFAAHLVSKIPVKKTIKDLATELTATLDITEEFTEDPAAYEELLTKVDFTQSISIDKDGILSLSLQVQTDLRYPYTKQYAILLNTLGYLIGGWDPTNPHHYVTWEEDNDGEIYEFVFELDVHTGKVQYDYTSVLIGLHGHTFTEIEDFNLQQLTQFITDYGYEYDEADPDDDNGPNLAAQTSHKDKLAALIKFLQEL